MKIIALSKNMSSPLELFYNERMGFKMLYAYQYHDNWMNDFTILAMAQMPINPLTYAYVLEAEEKHLKPCRPNNFLRKEDKEFFLIESLPYTEVFQYQANQGFLHFSGKKAA